MSSAYKSSSVQFYENGTSYKDKNGQTHPYKTAYITHTPDDSTAQHRIPLVLVGGWTSVKEDWLQFLPGTASQRPVLTFDNRGMGQSSIVDGPYTMDQFVNDTHLIIKHAFPSHPRIHLMGISMGGMIVQSYVIAHPSHVQSLIIGCSHSSARHSVRSPAAGDFVASMSGPPPTTRDEIIAYVTAVQRFQYTDAWIKANPQKFKQAVENSMIYKRPVRGQTGQYAAIVKYDVRDRVGSIKCPTLVIHGTGDKVIDCENGRLVHKNIKHSEFLELKDVGHIFWNMDDGQSMKRVAEFIAKNDKQTSSKL